MFIRTQISLPRGSVILADLIKYAFVSGEIAPSLLGRSDLEKYDLGVAEAENFFVDYRGGLSNRAGQRFVDEVQKDWLDTKFIPFKFGPSVLTTYNILFGDLTIRFIQDGAYVLESAKVITAISQANPAVVTSAGHGYANGDLVKVFDVVGMTQVNFRTFEVRNVAANTFELHRLDIASTGLDSSAFTAYVSGGNAYRVYTVVSPYAAADLHMLKFKQSRSVIRLTHPSYKRRVLTRISDTNWTLAIGSAGSTIAAPTGVTLTPSGAGVAGMAVAIVAVDKDGQESLPSAYAFNALSVNYAAAAGSLKITWTPVTGAQFYKVYRSQIIPVGADISRSMELGFIGFAYGPDFTDNNIIPDFTQTPPTYYDPFADNSIIYIAVTAGGAGYTRASVISASGGGTGFEAYPVVLAGVLVGIVIVNGGKDYVAPVISATIGAGATFSVTQTASSGNNPRISSVFQQRAVYAGTSNNPLTIDGSQPALPDLFDASSIASDGDAWEFELDSDEVAPIEWLTSTRSGLILWTTAGIWQLAGGTTVAVTPNDAIADPQSYTGIQDDLPPLPIDTDLIYAEAKGNKVRLLSYNDLTKVFAGQDLSILSNHLLTTNNKLRAWDYASDPFKLVYGVRSDGIMILLALVKEQNVYGFSRATTAGQYYDALVLQENQVDTPYLMVQRYINGRWAKVIEQVVPRAFDHVEDCWFLDCALSLGTTSPVAGIVIPDAVRGATVTVVADAAVFGAGDVNKILRVGGGKFLVTVYTNTTHINVQCLRAMKPAKLLSQTSPTECRADSGEWFLDAEVSSVSGLWHLEGRTVTVFADGNVVSKTAVVANGAIALAVPASRVVVGLPYRSIVKTLPPTVSNQIIEGRLKRIIGAQLRVLDSRGLQAGPTLDSLKSVKERSNEPYSEPTELQNRIEDLKFDGRYDRDGQFYIVSDDPLPLTILGFTYQPEIGDAESD